MRALGAFYGLAIGDALGMPTEGLPRERVTELFGALDGFRAASPDLGRNLPAGHVTDDTDQAVIVARCLVEGRGRVDHEQFARELLDWERRMQDAGSADLLGPSTLRALHAVASGAPVGTTGRWGDTNGAAMRVTPLGIATRPRPLEDLCAAVADLDRLTHDTTVANAGAAAVAAVVSAGIDGFSWVEAMALGVGAARFGAEHGWYAAGADVARRIAWAVGLVADAPDDDVVLDLVVGLVGTGLATQESVPAAFAIASRHPGNPWRAGLLAARLGGDSDTIAAMAMAMVGACTGLDALPAHAVATVKSVNALDLEPVVDELLSIRSGSSTAIGAAAAVEGGAEPAPGPVSS